MTKFTESIIEIIKSIPAGSVMTYGQIADLAGNPRAARQVVRVLHSISDKYDLPWHRVVNSKGQIAIPDHQGYVMQKTMLLDEGIVFDENDRIDLEKYLYKARQSDE